MLNILVTGGTGFIGSHTCIDLLENNYKITIVDSNINSSSNVLNQINLIANQKIKSHKNIIFEKGDIRDISFLDKVFYKAKKNKNPIEAVIHFAGLKSVKESVLNQFLYWENNVSGSISLLKIMEKYDCRTIVFSSSATVYGNVESIPIFETDKIKPINPYGSTKEIIERILESIFEVSKPIWNIAILRYFNPIGAHISGLIGENPHGIPNNLFPLICGVASGKYEQLTIYGKDWPTKDGTGIRDYIHVMDLAESHRCALEYLFNNKSKLIKLNIGTGIGTSVLELINQFKISNKCEIRFKFSERRAGDVPILVADNKKAISLLNWQPKKGLDDMCSDGWKWFSNQNK